MTRASAREHRGAWSAAPLAIRRRWTARPRSASLEQQVPQHCSQRTSFVRPRAALHPKTYTNAQRTREAYDAAREGQCLIPCLDRQ